MLPWTCAPAGVGSTNTESLSLSNFYLIAVMWHIKKYVSTNVNLLTSLLFPTHILSSLASPFRAEISVS